ncbi:MULTISPECIES: DUF1523 family protein [Salipiger]|uniref:DUF1523 domain-containing protein n=1 Tax=Salipiger bermudensis (strain DSM 26914 / JCM 13377 / KCTC 12554 / HTCC2601) TaxID=314265 RepID=Q0FVI8_SALBH|nr:DUF1523 family protein [Salipiger bermudensis]EAU48138.1 hypothetical protein R2601_14270 [Salipiger bermudensis HTCC2601]MBN9676196.1 DUF1523 family protein [Salipiger bermudensis]MBR9892062.1 DUF1523 family protein [bacterium]MCA1287445.1 DUF1523 family protein [Salipiger bermudensis]
MRYVKWSIIVLFWALVAAFLHYTLPQHDIARISDTYEKRIDPGENSLFWSNAATGETLNVTGRDVFFIQTRLNDDDVMVYRNEDTGWGWPPYFKFDTANLQAEAADLRSTAAAPQWVVIRHYGWRNEFLSVYPNVVSLRPVDGPDVRIIPWLNIILLTLLVAVVWALYVRWRRFRQARIDPVLDDMGDNLDEAGGRLKGFFRRKG